MNDRLDVIMLDVGQGDCTVVLLPDERAVVFDCADDHVLRKTLDAWKVPAIEAFVLSHLDQDHICGALGFLEAWPRPIHCVYLSTDRDITDEHDEAKRVKKLIDYAKEMSQDGASRQRRWELLPNTRDHRALASGQGWSVHLLAPPHAQILRKEREGAWEDANRYSSILRVEAGQNVMLIGADAPLLSWSGLPSKERRARLFRVPHHGGALDDGGIPQGWSVDRLYADVGADTTLISVGTNNRHGHPVQERIRPITGGACRLLCTQVTARCHAPIDVSGPDGQPSRNVDEIAALRERVLIHQNHWAEPQWRHLTEKRMQVRKGRLEVPCAGTVMVSLHVNGHVDVLPRRGGEHERVVDAWESPLCRDAGR